MRSSLQSSIDVDLPVVDISQFPREFDAEEFSHLKYHHGVAAVRDACEEYGFFYVVNHGIPTDLLQNVESAAHQLIAMLAKVKDRATAYNFIHTYARRGSLETLSFDIDSINETLDRIWPEGNPPMRHAIRNYIGHLQALQQIICKIILASLGLDAKAFYRSYFESCAARLCINCYSCDGKSLEEEVLFPHTDLDCITILYQDNVGGLQIRSEEDEWLNVKPAAYSFVVNVGDSLKAWTNGRYRGAVHRVVYKGWKERMSISYLVRFPDQEIWAPPELVDDDHPRRYRPFTYSQFRKEYVGSQANRPNYIDEYAGI